MHTQQPSMNILVASAMEDGRNNLGLDYQLSVLALVNELLSTAHQILEQAPDKYKYTNMYKYNLHTTPVVLIQAAIL